MILYCSVCTVFPKTGWFILFVVNTHEICKLVCSRDKSLSYIDLGLHVCFEGVSAKLLNVLSYFFLDRMDLFPLTCYQDSWMCRKLELSP